MRSATSWAELLNLFLLRIITLAVISALILYVYKVTTFLASLASQIYFRPVVRMHWAARFSSLGRLQPKSSSTAASVGRSGTQPSSARSTSQPAFSWYSQRRSVQGSLSQVYCADIALVGLHWDQAWQSFPGWRGACAATCTGMRSAQNQDL